MYVQTHAGENNYTDHRIGKEKNMDRELDRPRVNEEPEEPHGPFEPQEPHIKPFKHLKGVVCDATKCTYHDGDSCCAADRISIGPSFASSSGETVCATFKPKNL